ncbi:MAG: hypothetical protein WC846_00120 [Candidatus Gracilibacteria bacterium]|jgi:hypothetical protein
MGIIRFVFSKKGLGMVNQYLKDKESVSKKDFQPHFFEASSIPFYEAIFRKYGREFKLISDEEFLKDPDPKSINIPFDVSAEAFLYNEVWDPPLPLDGRPLIDVLGDKYVVYKIVRGIQGIRQPLTLALKGHADLKRGVEEIRTSKIVLKPRFFGYEARNVLLVNRARLENISQDERLNFSEYIMQEYLEDIIWPPEEWRFHFIGRKLCRVMKITDKNNWSGVFKQENVLFENVPAEFMMQAEKVVKNLIKDLNNRDNFTIDFLRTKDGLVFLEANIGTLGSIYVQTEEDATFVEPIFVELFRHLDKMNG